MPRRVFVSFPMNAKNKRPYKTKQKKAEFVYALLPAFPISVTSLFNTIVGAYCIWTCPDAKLHLIQLVHICIQRLPSCLLGLPKSCVCTYIARLALNQSFG